MNRQDWINAYEPIPQALEYRVKHVLEHLEDAPKTVRRMSLRTALIVLAMVLALCGAAYAIFESKTAEIFGWYYGGGWKEEMQNGDFAPMGQSYRLGDVTYTIEEIVYKTEGDYRGLYGVVRIAPAEGTNVVILPEDVSVQDPAGYLLHYDNVDQTISEEASSYAELAAQRNAKLLVVRAAVNSVAVDGVAQGDCFGENWLPQPDGTLLGTIEIPDVPYAGNYELNLWVSNWETTLNGIWLREDPENTWLKYDWIVNVSPQ